MDAWEKDGQKRTKLKVRASVVKFLGPPQPQQGGQAQDAGRPQAPGDYASRDDVMGDLPF